MYRGSLPRQSLNSAQSSHTICNNPCSATLNLPSSSNSERLRDFHAQSYQYNTAVFQSNSRRTPANHFPTNTTPTHFPNKNSNISPSGYFEPQRSPQNYDQQFTDSFKNASNWGDNNRNQTHPGTLENNNNLTSSCRQYQEVVGSYKSNTWDTKKSYYAAHDDDDDTNNNHNNTAFVPPNSIQYNALLNSYKSNTWDTKKTYTGGDSKSVIIPHLPSNGGDGAAPSGVCAPPVCCDVCESGYDSERTITVCRCGFSWRKTIRELFFHSP